MNLLDSMIAWVIDLVVGAFSMFAMSIVQVLDVNLALFRSVFPFVSTSYDIFRVSATSLIALMIMWGFFKNFLMPMGADAEHPFKVIARGAIAWFLSWNALALSYMLISIAGTPFQLMVDAPDPPLEFASMAEIVGVIVASAFAGGAMVPMIFAMVFTVLVIWNFLKLMIEAVERYLVVGVLVYTSPLAFAMAASKGTMPVLQSWLRMLGGQTLLLILNVWTMRMFFGLIRTFIANPLMGNLGTTSPPEFVPDCELWVADFTAWVEAQGAYSSLHALGPIQALLLWAFIILAFLKLAQKFDNMLNQLGLNVTQTGGRAVGDLIMAGMAMKNVGGMMGGMFGRSGGAGGGSGLHLPHKF